LVALVAAGSLALTGCSNSEEPADPNATGSTGAAPAATRTVTHAMGTTEVPAQPTRVVVLDTGELDAVVALGVTPVGAVTTDVSSDFPSYLRDKLSGTQKVGTIQQPELETIASLQPDLILSNKRRHAELYDKLSEIAPTVFAEDVGKVWKENFLLDAEALGKKAEGERLLAEYEQRAKELGQSLGDPSSVTVSAVRFVAGSETIRAYTDNSFLGTVLTDVGVSRPEGQKGTATFNEVSRENVAQLNGDVLLYSSYGSPDVSGEKAVTEGPQWAQLSAVQQGKAFRVDDDYFYTGIGLTAANRVLDDLQNYLTK